MSAEMGPIVRDRREEPGGEADRLSEADWLTTAETWLATRREAERLGAENEVLAVKLEDMLRGVAGYLLGENVRLKAENARLAAEVGRLKVEGGRGTWRIPPVNFPAALVDALERAADGDTIVVPDDKMRILGRAAHALFASGKRLEFVAAPPGEAGGVI